MSSFSESLSNVRFRADFNALIGEVQQGALSLYHRTKSPDTKENYQSLQSALSELNDWVSALMAGNPEDYKHIAHKISGVLQVVSNCRFLLRLAKHASSDAEEAKSLDGNLERLLGMLVEFSNQHNPERPLSGQYVPAVAR